MNQHQQIQAAQNRELARPEAEHSVVYGIVAQCLCPDHVWIKIGRSTQPQARLARLNTIIRKHLREDAFRPGPFSLSWQWPDRECIEHQPLALRFMMPGWRNTERLMRNLVAAELEARQTRGEWLELPTGHDTHWMDPALAQALRDRQVDRYLTERGDRAHVDQQLEALFAHFNGTSIR